MPYRAPTQDIRFILEHVVGIADVLATKRFSGVTPDLADAILTEAGRISTDVLAPLNRSGDAHPARLENGVVVSSPGFAEGYRAIASGGWVGMAASPDHGGMGLPISLALGVDDMMSGACLALHLKPLLSKGQIEALEHHASDEIKALYLPRLTSGEWSGTMNLTEPQAGTDVGALRSRAEPKGDGTYAISGQKIFITWGDSDLTANVCHLVLARLPDGAEGTKGISLFMVPKFIPDADGNPGRRNTLRVVSLEHKLGIHGSPTCVMQYDGATGWLVGEPHKGMAAMFTMMNNARLSVAAQGVGVAEAALQHALAFARERRQGATPLAKDGAIIDHADVRRMLGTMRAEIFAARAIALSCAKAIDMASATGAAEWQARAALLTPIAKAYCTDVACSVAHQGVQIHGGMGFIEETGAAQFLRDARILPIYEGTNGIQAMDLVGRKLADGGEAAFRLIDEVQRDAEAARPGCPDLAGDLWSAAEALRDATESLLARAPNDRFAGAVPYLRAYALVLGGQAHLKAAAIDPARTPLARLMIRRLLPEHGALLAQALEGASGLYDLSDDILAA
ncbi:MAG: acyl-CoA dehydrogenase [Tabrizicola sp.]|nr:acyl-CoA dehydrogenase [Tabrizicola sp.]